MMRRSRKTDSPSPPYQAPTRRETRLDLCAEWVWEVAPSGEITYSNSAVRDILGYTPERVVGSSAFNYVAQSSEAELRELIKPTRDGLEKPTVASLRFIAADGTQRNLETTRFAIRTDTIKPILFRFLSKNATQEATPRQAAEEALASCHAAIEESPIGIIIIQDERVVFGNRKIIELMGYTPEEASEVGMWNLVHPEEREMVRQRYFSLLAGEYVPPQYVIRVFTKSGELKYLEHRPVLISYNGRPAILDNMIDVTDRELAQQALKQSEEYWRALTENALDIIAVLTPEAIVDYISPSATKVLGYRPEELTGRSLWDFISSEDLPSLKQAFVDTATNPGLVGKKEYHFRHSDGGWRILESVGVAHELPSGLRVVVNSRDVTARHGAEQALRQRTAELEAIFSAFPDIYFWLDSNGRITGYHAGSPEHLYLPPADFLGKTPSQVLPAELGKEFEAAAARAFWSGEIQSIEYPLRVKDRMSYYEARIVPIAEKQVFIIIRDITGRKKAEEALEHRLSFEKALTSISAHFINMPVEKIDEGIDCALRTIGSFTGIDRAYLFKFRDGKYMDNTHEWCREGVSSEMHNLKDIEFERFPWITGQLRALNTVYVRTLEDLPPEARAEREEFEREQIKSLVNVPLVQRGEAIGFLGLDSVKTTKDWSEDDLTLLKILSEILVNALDRAAVEEALRASEDRYRGLVESINDWVWGINEDGVYNYVSPRCRTLLGYEPAEMLGKTPFDFMPPGEAERLKSIFDQVCAKREAFNLMENTIIRKDGSLVVVETSGTPVFDERGTFRGYRGIDRDVTEKKQAEQALRDNERFLRSIFDGIQDSISVSDKNLNVIRVNAAMEKWYHFRMPLVGKTCYEAYHGKCERCEVCPAVRSIESKSLQTEIVPFTGPNGEVAGWLELHAFPLFNEHGEVWGVIEHVRDITDRVLAEQALRDNEERLRKQQNAVAEITGSEVIESEDLQRILGLMTEVAARTIDVDRVSIWHYNDDHSQLLCLEEFSRAEQVHSAGATISVADNPEYFREIERSKIVACDARSDERTSKFAASYLEPLGIASMLDSPIRMHGRTIGVVCFEQLGEPRAWKTDEEVFASAIADLISLAIEADERRQAENALAEAEAKYRSLVEESLVGVYIIQGDRFAYVNPRFAEIFGYTQQEIILEMKVADLVHPDDLPIVEENIRKRYAGETISAHYTFRGIRKDGEQVHCEVLGTISPYQSKPAIIGSMLDVTERTKAEEAIRHSEERYRLLFENSPDIVVILHHNRIIQANRAVERILGYSPSEVVGRYPWDISPPKQPSGRSSRSEALHYIREATERGSHTFQWVHQRKDGSPVDCEISLSALTVHDETYIQAIVRDITERKLAEDRRLAFERQVEQQKRQFYRDTILSVTGGKLDVCDEPDIAPYIETAAEVFEVRAPRDVSGARAKVRQFCEQHGLTGERFDSFLVGVGEAITNAIKHGVEGCVRIGCRNKDIWVAISDKGAGIESLILPRAVLLRGYSTKPSLGLGYSIMLEVSDRIMLNTGKKGTTVVLVKSIEEPELVVSAENLPDTWDTIPDPNGASL
jgi:PAS domain S-box-containing protein